jgi:hypothetical protein
MNDEGKIGIREPEGYGRIVSGKDKIIAQGPAGST